MKVEHLVAATAVVLTVFLGLKPAAAYPVVWDFTPATSGALGTTHTYASTPAILHAQNVIVSGFGPVQDGDNNDGAIGPVTLYGKNDGPGEQGLGLTNDPAEQNEISKGSFIQIDLQGLSVPPLGSKHLSFQANSATGDLWKVYGTNTAGSLARATFIRSGSSDDIIPDLGVDILGIYKYLDVTADRGNVLLREIDNSVNLVDNSVNPVPEPASLALLLFGLAGLGLARRYRA